MVVGIEKMLNIPPKKTTSLNTLNLMNLTSKAYIAENETSEHLAEHEAYLKSESAPKMVATRVVPQSWRQSSWYLSIEGYP